jgi:hypothetical protein
MAFGLSGRKGFRKRANENALDRVEVEGVEGRPAVASLRRHSRSLYQPDDAEYGVQANWTQVAFVAK